MFDPMIGLLGLGVAGDAFGAYSAMRQQARQRDAYNQAMQLAREQTNPAAVLGRANQYYNQGYAQLRSAIPDIMRSEVNPMLGLKGIDPSGGQGQLILNQALAPYYANLWQNAVNQAQGGYQGANTALQNAGQMTGTPYGSMGGTANALQSMMLLRALRGGGGGGAQTPQPNLAMPGMAPAQSTTWEEMTPWQSTSMMGNQV